MAWCRPGGRCDNGGEGSLCPKCPGSDLYIFVNTGGYIECYCNEHPMFSDVWEMAVHILDHDRKGDHVSRPLLAYARDVERRIVHELFEDVRERYEEAE